MLKISAFSLATQWLQLNSIWDRNHLITTLTKKQSPVRQKKMDDENLQVNSKLSSFFSNVRVLLRRMMPPSMFRYEHDFQTISDDTVVLLAKELKAVSEGEIRLAWSDLIWCTYRTGLPPEFANGTDTGWGCMYRTCQMMIAAGLRVLGFSRTEAISYIIDSPDAVFSILNLAHSRSDEKVWGSPLSVCLKAQQASARFSVKDFAMHVSGEGSLYKENVSQTPFVPFFYFIVLRLGSSFNTAYTKALQDSLRFPLCIGIIGGKSYSSFYFTGFQESRFLFLDPHYVQKNDNGSFESYSCKSIFSIQDRDLDPSMALGFACRTEKDAAQFWEFMIKLSEEHRFISLYNSKKDHIQTLLKVEQSWANDVDEHSKSDDEYVMV